MLCLSVLKIVHIFVKFIINSSGKAKLSMASCLHINCVQSMLSRIKPKGVSSSAGNPRHTKHTNTTQAKLPDKNSLLAAAQQKH